MFGHRFPQKDILIGLLLLFFVPILSVASDVFFQLGTPPTIELMVVIFLGLFVAHVKLFSRSPALSTLTVLIAFGSAIYISYFADNVWPGACTGVTDCGFNPDPGFHLTENWLGYVMWSVLLGWLPYRVVNFVVQKARVRQVKSVD